MRHRTARRRHRLVYCRVRAIALSRKLVLLTRNHRDLGKVPGFLIEDCMV
ncbi:MULTISPECIES: type II toxin-antitoxin system VapC family toxin [unclassified Nostoc]|nr:type II toxin-antitoxin system VapC family toxin [Nostoc sp. 'Peltigera membranacea cyanobiont' 232]